MAKKVEVDVKLMIAAIALVIILAVGSSFATFLMLRSNNNLQATADASSSSPKQKMGPTLPVGEFTLNLASPSNHKSFIRTEMVLEVSDKKALAELEKRQPQVRDSIISLIRSQTAEQLSTETGLELLRFEIIQRISSFINKGEVIDVYFIDLIIQ